MRRRGLSLTNGRCRVRRLRGENATRRPSNSRVLMAGVVCGEMEGEWRARSGRAARVAWLSTEWLWLSAVCTIVVASSAVGFRCVTEVLCPMPFGLWPSGRAFAVEKGGEKCTVFRQNRGLFVESRSLLPRRQGLRAERRGSDAQGAASWSAGVPFIARRRGYR